MKQHFPDFQLWLDRLTPLCVELMQELPPAAGLKTKLVEKMEEHEGRVNHLYFDTRGNVTVGVGHLVASRNAIANVTLYTIKNNLANKLATLTEKQAEYDAISKLPYGLSYTGSQLQKAYDLDHERLGYRRPA